MTALSVAVKYLQGRSVASTLTAFSVALGVSLVIASFLLTRGIKEGFIDGTTDYSLVVGAKGSPTQLVLNVVFHDEEVLNHQGKGNILLFPTISRDTARAGPIWCYERLGGSSNTMGRSRMRFLIIRAGASAVTRC